MKENHQKTKVKSKRDDTRYRIANKFKERQSIEQPKANSSCSAIERIQVVIPLYNEEDNIEATVTEVLSELQAANFKAKILLVDDGSTDSSKNILVRLSAAHPGVSYISFSRNFGKEAAISAGLNECGDDFDLLAYMDCDGQHTAKHLVRLIRECEQSDVDLVCGVRINRDYQTARQRTFRRLFYALFHLLSEQRLDEGIGDFNVLRPRVVEAVRGLKEVHPFMKGLVNWVGFRRKLVAVTIEPRAEGVAKFTTARVFRLALDGVFSFSSWPLRVWSIVGATIAMLSFLYLLFVMFETITWGREVPGYATIVILLLGLGGIQLLSIGIIGEYIGRIYDAAKSRPRYIISERGP